MPTLDVRDEPLLGASNVHIRYSSLFPPTTTAKQNLANAVTLTRTALAEAYTALKPQPELPKVQQSILRYHFRLGGGPPPPDYAKCAQAVRKVVEMIINGTNGGLVIADVRSKFISEFMDREGVGMDLFSLHGTHDEDLTGGQLVKLVKQLEGQKPDAEILRLFEQDSETYGSYGSYMKMVEQFKKELAEFVQKQARGEDPKHPGDLLRGYVNKKVTNTDDVELFGAKKKWAHKGIHLNFDLLEGGDYFQSCPLAIARTLVHEASHKFCGTKDHAYAYQEDEYLSVMSSAEALNNADSYAWAVISLYSKRSLHDLHELALAATQM